MPIPLAALLQLTSPPTPGLGARMMSQAASGLRESAQLDQTRQYQEGVLQNAQEQEAGRNARKIATELGLDRRAQAQRDFQNDEAATKAYDDYRKLLLEPGGAARAALMHDALKGHGFTVTEDLAPPPPIPIASLNMSGGPTIAPPRQGTGKYRFRRGDKDYGEVDLSGLNDADRAATKAQLDQLRALGDAEVRGPAEAGILEDETLRGPEALKQYRETVDPALARKAAKERAAIMAQSQRAAAGRSEERGDMTDLGKFENMVRQNTASIARNNGIVKLNEEARAIEASIAQMQSGNPIGENDAILSKIKSQQGGRISDADYAAALKNAGIWEAVQNMVSNIGPNGVTDEYRDIFLQAATILKELNDQRRAAVATQVGNFFRNDAFTERYAHALGMDVERVASRAENGVLDLGMESGGGDEGGGFDATPSTESLGTTGSVPAVPIDDEDEDGALKRLGI